MTQAKPKHKAFVLGLVGGIASGKSHLAKLFEQRGAVVIDADQLAHQVLKRPLVARSLAKTFGLQILDENHEVRRSELAKLVFGDSPEAKARLRVLEELTHPQIHADAVRKMHQLQESETPPPLIVIDAPLLIEANWMPMCDFILYIDTPAEVRLQRALSRGWSEADFAAREAAQLSLDEKRQVATHFIHGSAPDAELLHAIERFFS